MNIRKAIKKATKSVSVAKQTVSLASSTIKPLAKVADSGIAKGVIDTTLRLNPVTGAAMIAKDFKDGGISGVVSGAQGAINFNRPLIDAVLSGKTDNLASVMSNPQASVSDRLLSLPQSVSVSTFQPLAMSALPEGVVSVSGGNSVSSPAVSSGRSSTSVSKTYKTNNSTFNGIFGFGGLLGIF